MAGRKHLSKYELFQYTHQVKRTNKDYPKDNDAVNSDSCSAPSSESDKTSDKSSSAESG